MPLAVQPSDAASTQDEALMPTAGDGLDLGSELTEFSGQLALFPLPSTVLLPRTILPLHVFEPRYRRMLDDVMAGDGLIGVILLKPGEQGQTFQQPPLHSIGGLGKVMDVTRLPDGRSNLILLGLSRFEVREEIEVDRPYRLARVDLLQDGAVSPGCPALKRFRSLIGAIPDSLLRDVRNLFHGMAIKEQPGAMVDLVMDSLALSASELQEILSTVDVAERAELAVKILLHRLQTTPQNQPARDWLPGPNLN